jgi:hypothetical protein
MVNENRQMVNENRQMVNENRQRVNEKTDKGLMRKQSNREKKLNPSP